jgi:hypothetical protein
MKHVFAAVAFLLMIAHRLPAPIVEEEKPTPAPAQSVKPKPKSTTTSKRSTRESQSAAISRPRPTPFALPAKRFAGSWTGTVATKNPLLGGGSHQTTYLINAAENSVTATGPVGTFTHRATVSGDKLTFKEGVLGEITVTVTIGKDPRTAQVSVEDGIWGRSSGVVKKQ